MNNLKVIIFLGFFFLSAPVLGAETLEGSYRATVLEVIDGDTFWARVRIWLGQETEILMRLDGIDTPELRGKCARERALSVQAKKKLETLIDQKIVTLSHIRYGKYAGRILATVQLPDQTPNISDLMLAGTVARSYHGRKRVSWC
ncbi:MAG: nuclease [Alphaproteobacteria bacterium CG_4_9_14_3_um_filter_47_13]|nr:MAG: nuclease [Alphaproteobacteria bacterium CG_4_9_14_3_um_filter_47_13]